MLRNRGFKLTVRELAEARSAPPRDLHELVGAAQELRQLNFPSLPGEFHLMNLGPPGPPIALIKAGRPFWAATDSHLGNQTWDDLAEAARQAQPALGRLRALAHQWIPEHGLGPKTPVFDFIGVAFWLGADAVSSLRQGVRESALQDLETLTGLAQIGSAEKDHIAQIGRYGVIGISLKTTWEMLQSVQWTEPELKRMESAWERVWSLHAVEAAAESELACVGERGDELRKELARARWQERVVAWVGLTDEADDEQFQLEWSLAYWEAARALQRGENWRVLGPSLEKMKSNGQARIHSRYRHLALQRNLPIIDRTFETCAGYEAARQLLLADIAIRKFKLHNNGAPPKSLRGLTPEFLRSASGRDVFGGGDLKYHPNPDGSYLLYSVGVDGVDNGGQASAGPGDDPFWKSRDMVWPSCR